MIAVLKLVVAAAIIDALEDMDLKVPKVDKARRREMAGARAELLGRGRGRDDG